MVGMSQRQLAGAGSRLQGTSDPEQKRRIIGREFVEIFQQEAARIDDAKWLAQGTIYPDVIESAGSTARTIADRRCFDHSAVLALYSNG